jgi:hypothetical protein
MCKALNDVGNEISKTFSPSSGGGSQNGQTFKGADSTVRAAANTAAPAIGARRRGSVGMGAGSLLTGPSGIAQGALTTGKSSLLGQ